MRNRLLCSVAILVTCLTYIERGQAQEEREVRGRVVNAQGEPVAGAAVSAFWDANGTHRDASGRQLKLPEDTAVYWQQIGAMEPQLYGTLTDVEGRFTVRTLAISHHVMALDAERKRGGLAILPKGQEGEPVEIKLGPLVTVRGSFVTPDGAVPDWTYVYAEVSEDPARPIDFPRLAGCGSRAARFEFVLPPGRYLLDGYNGKMDARMAPSKAVELTADVPEVDLGVLKLSPHLAMNDRKGQAKAAGEWQDFNDLFGKPCPDWHATDARGIDKDVQPADLRGKWVLLDFWGLDCAPCLRSGLPRVAKFYKEHSGQRDKFEIISICMDIDGDVQDMAELDRRLAPIVKHVWNGESLPFPVLLDPSFKTWSRFGLRGMGQTMLIDPNGILMDGDEKTLAEHLK